MTAGRKKKTTTEKGLGYAHQKARKAMPAPKGDPCPYCRRPMWEGQLLDLDHAIPRAFNGGGALRWAHASCNRSSGATLGNRLRKGKGRALPEVRWIDRWS